MAAKGIRDRKRIRSNDREMTVDKAALTVQAAADAQMSLPDALRIAGLSQRKFDILLEERPDLEHLLVDWSKKLQRNIERAGETALDWRAQAYLLDRLDKLRNKQQPEAQVNIQLNQFLSDFQSSARDLALESDQATIPIRKAAEADSP